MINDKNGKPFAFFKPDDEVANGPNNPNVEHRKPIPSKDDIFFYQVNSWDQGKARERQLLAEMLHVGTATRVPLGSDIQLTSDVFFDLEAQEKNEKARVQTKRGYVQEWMTDHKPMVYFAKEYNAQDPKIDEEAFLSHKNPILDQVSLDQYQELAINDLLIYNEDRHAANLLVSFDKGSKPNLILIDQDLIFPWKLKSLHGVNHHEKSKMPFTEASLKIIRELDPELIGAMVAKMDLSEQAPINAKVMAMVIKRFAEAGATLHDIDSFVSLGDRGKDGVSQLWKIMEEVRETAVNSLSEDEKGAYNYAGWLRRADWCETVKKEWCHTVAAEAQAEAALWQKNYQKNEAEKLQAKVDKGYWKEIERRLDIEIQKYKENKKIT